MFVMLNVVLMLQDVNVVDDDADENEIESADEGIEPVTSAMQTDNCTTGIQASLCAKLISEKFIGGLHGDNKEPPTTTLDNGWTQADELVFSMHKCDVNDATLDNQLCVYRIDQRIYTMEMALRLLSHTTHDDKTSTVPDTSCTPTSEQLMSLSLVHGSNKIMFCVKSKLQGTKFVTANIWLFNSNTKFVGMLTTSYDIIRSI